MRRIVVDAPASGLDASATSLASGSPASVAPESLGAPESGVPESGVPESSSVPEAQAAARTRTKQADRMTAHHTETPASTSVVSSAHERRREEDRKLPLRQGPLRSRPRPHQAGDLLQLLDVRAERDLAGVRSRAAVHAAVGRGRAPRLP